MIEQEQFYVLSRILLCEAKVAEQSTNWEGLCGTPWQMVAPEMKLTKKVTADKEGAGPPLPKIVVERAPEAEPRRFCVLSADIEAHGHKMRSACTAWKGDKATKRRMPRENQDDH